MSLIHFRQIKRELIIFVIGILVLCLGAIYPWYRLPSETLITFEANLFLANIGRILPALMAFFAVFFVCKFNLNRIPRIVFWCGIFTVLLFPYFITTWLPRVTYIATAYYNQGQRISFNVEKNFPYVQSQWKQHILLEQSLPIKSISDFTISDISFFQISSWDRFLIEGLGYSNSFFAFIGRGCSLTLVGLVICLFSIYLNLEDEAFNRLLKDVGILLPWVSIGTVVLVVSLVFPNILNYHLDVLFARGKYHQVTLASQILATCYPPLQGDEEFLKRMAESSFYGNKPDIALISFTKGLESYRLGDFTTAEDYFRQSLSLQPKRFLIRGYLATAILNQGILSLNSSDINGRRPGVAADLFEQALQIFPNHIEALYDLMLARVVNGEFDKSTAVAKQIIENQRYLQQPNLGLLGQAYLHRAWNSYYEGDLNNAWQKYRQSFDSTTWKESETQ